jgi:hypothetical protein
MPHEFNFNSPVGSTGVDSSPSLADVSPVSTSMHRWGAPPHPSPIAVHHNPMDHSQHQHHHHHHHHVDANGVPQSSQVAYSYMLDANDRAISYSPAGDANLMAPFPTPASDGVSGFPQNGPGGHHQQQMTPTMTSPAFAQFPGTPQSFIATSPHEPDHTTQQLMSQGGTVDGQNVMFTMPADKSE